MEYLQKIVFMRRQRLLLIGLIVLLLAIFLPVTILFLTMERNAPREVKPDPVVVEQHPGKMVKGFGYVRGSSMITLKNKYAGYVKKVNFYTGQKIMCGDVIIEYDDLDWRLRLTQAANAVREQQKVVESKELALQLKKLNPLPSEYRNASWKQMAAKEKLSRLKQELDAYEKLHGNRIVSDFSLREKTQDYKDAEADVESLSHDISIINKGLGALYIDIAEKDLEDARTKLEDLKKVQSLIEEDGNHYRIVSPRNGIVVNNSDTVNAYDGAASNVAEIHSFNNGSYVYCYFDEREVGYVTEGKVYRFRTTQFDCTKNGYPLIRPFEVKKNRSSSGDRSLYLVKCQLVSSPIPLRINSTGQMEIDIK